MARKVRRGLGACKPLPRHSAIELLHAVTSSYVAEVKHGAIRPPRGDKIECYTLVVLENRARPKGPEVRLKVAILKARRPLAADPVVYLAGGPGDAPLIASAAGADPLAEGDWWNDTAVIRRRRDVIIVSERGAGGSTPNLDCFEPRTTEPAR